MFGTSFYGVIKPHLPTSLPGLFVAVANSGTGDRVMTSPDGITWTVQVSAADNAWSDVTFGNNLFVAVATSGTDRVMTSPDGVNWSLATASAASPWVAIAWNGTVFAALSATGGVMTSPDGINWTNQTPASLQNWSAITWAQELGLFVAIANGGTAGQRVMTSPDGVTWTQQSSLAAPDGPWREITWSSSLGLLIAVAQGNTFGGSAQIMTSPDGVTWTQQSSADTLMFWTGVQWAPEIGLAAAVGSGPSNVDSPGTDNRVMTSPDGINWTIQADAGARTWRSIRWSGSTFAAIANSGTGNRVMTSPDGINWTAQSTNDNNWLGLCWANGTF
jgi:hypothetical protein